MASNVPGALAQACLQKEVTFGTDAISTDAIKLFWESEDLKLDPEYAEDNSLLGTRAPSAKYPTYTKIEGGFNYVSYPDALGWLYYLTMGKQNGSRADSPDGAIIVYYSGSSTSCTLALSTAGLFTVASSTGTLFTIDSTSTSYDTLTELSTGFQAESNIESEVLYGGTALSNQIASFTAVSIRKQSKKLDAVPASATSYQYNFVLADFATPIPSFSLMVDKNVDIQTNTGTKIDSMTVEMEPGTVLKGALTLNSQNRSTGQTFPSSLTVTDSDPFIVDDDVCVYINGVKQLNIAKATLTINNNLSKEDKRLCSNTYIEPQGQAFTVELDGEMYYNTDTVSYASGFKAGTEYEVLICGKGLQEVESGKNYRFLLRMSRTKITDFSDNVDGQERMIVPFKFEVMNVDPDSVYEPFEVTYVTKTTTYST